MGIIGLLFKIVFFAWDLYVLAQLVNFLLPFFVKENKQPWMKMLADFCSPAVNIGKIVAKQIFGDKEFNFDMGALMGIVLSIVVGAVAGAVVFAIF